MNNTIKELKENPNMDMLMRDSLRVNMVDFKVFCNDVASYWGDLMPLMTCEESGELIKAISKYFRCEKELAKIKIDCEEDMAELYNAKTDIINEMGDVIVSIFSLASQMEIRYEDIISRCNLKTRDSYAEHHRE